MTSLIGIEGPVAVGVAVSRSVARAQDAGRTITLGELQWTPATRVKGLEQANLVCDSTKPGPYVRRVRLLAHFVSLPHRRREERTYTARQPCRPDAGTATSPMSRASMPGTGANEASLPIEEEQR